jgi:hypothetical protein
MECGLLALLQPQVPRFYCTLLSIRHDFVIPSEGEESWFLLVLAVFTPQTQTKIPRFARNDNFA